MGDCQTEKRDSGGRLPEIESREGRETSRQINGRGWETTRQIKGRGWETTRQIKGRGWETTRQREGRGWETTRQRKGRGCETVGYRVAGGLTPCRGRLYTASPTCSPVFEARDAISVDHTSRHSHHRPYRRRR